MLVLLMQRDFVVAVSSITAFYEFPSVFIKAGVLDKLHQ